MCNDDLKTPIYSMGLTKKMTGLTARQIRYYEEENLINPARTKGNQRLFSKHDVKKLNKIKELLNKGLNIAGILRKLEG
ncbi:hypothetical protein JCM16358_06080 [Halanaerocella petrolearia]